MALKIAKVNQARSFEQLEALGVRAFDAGDMEKAAAFFLDALELDDKNAALFLELGVSLIKQGKTDKALIAIKRSIELAPYEADAYNAMGIALYQLEFWGAAEKFFRHTLVLEPGHKAAKNSLIETLKRLRNGDNQPPAEFDTVLALLATRPPTLSLCMIAKNEEAFLGDCLASVQGLVDEIILVDTGSSDRTIEIAERFGAKIFHYEWNGDFASARNESLKHATGDWILVLDADETIAPEWHDEIKKALRVQENIGYGLVIDNLLGEKGERRQTAVIFRLFQNRPDMRYEGIVHEQVQPAAQRTGMPMKNLPSRILHRGYLNQTIEQRSKYQRNLEILLKQVQQEPDYAYVHYNLGQTYKLLDQHDEAEKFYRQALTLLKEQNQSHTIPYYASVYFGLANLYYTLEKYEEAIAVCDEGLVPYPEYPDLIYLKGSCFLKLERYDEAIRSFEACLKHEGLVMVAGNDPGVTTYKALHGIGVAYSRKGDLRQASQYLRRSHERMDYPDARVCLDLGIVLLQDEKLSEAVQFLALSLEIDENSLSAWFNLGVACSKLGKYDEAIAAWQKARELGPDTPELCFLLGDAYLRVGRFDEALEALETETQLNPELNEAWLQLGMAKLCNGDMTGALAALQAFGERPANERAPVGKALMSFLSLLQGETPDLTAHDLPAKQVIEIWIQALGQLFKAQRYADVEALVTAMRRLSYPELHKALGTLLLQVGLMEDGITSLLKAQEATPEDAEIYLLIGEGAEALGNLEDAEVMFQTALGYNPRMLVARQKLAQLRTRQKV